MTRTLNFKGGPPGKAFLAKAAREVSPVQGIETIE
jgi:hypothetical protein